MKCPMQGCPGEMTAKEITHTFVRRGHPFVVEGIPAHVCPICGYTVLDIEVLDMLLAFNPESDQATRHAPVFRLHAVAS